MAGGGSPPRTRGALELRADQWTFARRVALPVQEFLHVAWIGSGVLLLAAIVALVWANGPWAPSYHHLWETVLTLDVGFLRISMDLHHWINDGLMAVFFFVVGLEIKRELLHGNLSEPRKAALPAFAALGGMVVPAGIYFALNPQGEASAGWGIPMATDIAFAVGVLGLLGRRIPPQIRVFLLALAIVDDLGAIMVIAVFYTASISTTAIAQALMLVVVMVLMRRLGIRNVLAYAVVGFLFWAAVLESGIHATLAGVVLGILTPSRPYVGPGEFDAAAEQLLSRYRDAVAREDHDDAQATLGHLEELTMGTEAPLERLERRFLPWSAYLVLPVFALANAGVELAPAALASAMGSRVTLGVVLGLVVGKLVGVSAFAWLSVVSGLASLPDRVRWSHVVGTSLLAGVGFTVSLFITGLAFTDPGTIAEAKVGILVASLTAGIVGFLVLRLVGGEYHGEPTD
ncbi:MAG: Na+/H+ antiporter NhaA [Gemmatimonadetes bacterium]|nr:Na+/H+ antiporter NhaA [Gemmatimonadota bacterium]